MGAMKKMTRRTFGGGLDVAMCCDLRIAGAARSFNGGHRSASGVAKSLLIAKSRHSDVRKESEILRKLGVSNPS